MEIVCVNCGMKQLENKLHYCPFCFHSFSELNEQNSQSDNITVNHDKTSFPNKTDNKDKPEEKKLLNNLSISSTLKTQDDGKTFAIILKPLSQLIYDNIWEIIVFESLMLVLIFFISFFVTLMLIIFRFRFYFVYIYIISFILINLIKLIKLALTKNLTLNEINGKYSISNYFKINQGKISDLKNILVIKSKKKVSANKYHKAYTITSWELNIESDNGKRFFLNKFSYKDDEGKEAQGLLSSMLSDRNTVKIIEQCEEEKDLFNTFWSDNGQEARNLATKLAERLNIEIVKIDTSNE